MRHPAGSVPPSPTASPIPLAGGAFRLDPWRATLAMVGAVTALRIALLFTTPLELYPDEAQYWLWSRTPALGYFSKPPMIAWLIGATTAIGGDREAWVRLSAPLAHGLAALALHRAGARFYDARTGFRAAAIYTLMPGVQLSSVIIATDAPLLAFLSLAVWALGALWTAPAGRGGRAAAAAGGALGLAALSKYAALYYVAGLLVHAALDREGRRRLWNGTRAAACAGVFLLVVAPNAAWNVAHHFQTVAHTAADASLHDARPVAGVDPRGAGGFLLGQFGVFGPIPLAALLLGTAAAVRRRRIGRPDALLLSLTAPALLVVLAEAVAVRANANWAAAAYVAGAVLAATWMAGPRWRPWAWGGLALQGVGCLVFAAVILSPSLADALGLANSFKRARGWAATTALVHADLQRTRAAGRTDALAVDDRFLFNALAYYGREWTGAAGTPPLRMWVHEARAKNQAEAEDPLVARDGGRVAFVSLTYPRQSRWDFRRVEDVRAAQVGLDRERTRDLLFYTGIGFSPRPRDRRTGRPIAP